MSRTVRSGAALVAAALSLTALPASAEPHDAHRQHRSHVRTADTSVTERLAGADRYRTAARVAEDWAGFPVDRVWVATGETYPDALAAGAIAGQSNVAEDGRVIGEPLLLTKPDRVPAATISAIAEHTPDEIVVVGGTTAVSDAVVKQLADRFFAGDATKVRRVRGADRYDTAARIARMSENPYKVAYLATGEGFADALSAGWSAGLESAPVLLTKTGTLSAAARRYLVENDVTSVVIMGGTASISDAVEEEVRSLPSQPEVDRIAGKDRYATSALMASYWSDVMHDAPFTEVSVASGADFPDALAAGPFAASYGMPLLLTRPTSLPPLVRGTVDSMDTVAHGTIIGGTAAVSDAVEQELAYVIRSNTGN